MILTESLTDLDGNNYKTVFVGKQEWMTENLRVTKYSNGQSIPGGLNDSQWENIQQGAYALYPHNNIQGINSEPHIVESYGLLYNWFATVQEGGLCHTGWRVPDDND